MTDYNWIALGTLLGAMIIMTWHWLGWRSGRRQVSDPGQERLKSEFAAYSVIAVFAMQLLSDQFSSIAGPASADTSFAPARFLLAMAIGGLVPLVMLGIDATREWVRENRDLEAASTTVYQSSGAIIATVLASGVARWIEVLR